MLSLTSPQDGVEFVVNGLEAGCFTAAGGCQTQQGRPVDVPCPQLFHEHVKPQLHKGDV